MNNEDIRHEDVRQEVAEVRHIFEKQTTVQESKAAEKAAHPQELMRMLTEFLGKKQGGQTQEASATGDERSEILRRHQHPEKTLRAPAKVLCPSTLHPRGSTWRE